MIISSGKRLSGLINDILDFSKLREKDIQLATKAIDLCSVVEVDLRIMTPVLEGKDLKLLNTVAKDLVHVLADEDRLQQILLNLLGNAIKFTERGEIVVSAEAHDGMVAISVADSGIGIPADRLEAIFKPFDQVDGSAQRQYGGTGLGLAIARGFVQAKDGDITARNHPEGGAEFVIEVNVTAHDRPDH